MTTMPTHGLFSPVRNDGASSDQLAPEITANISTISAMLPPLTPPNANNAPLSACTGSVVESPTSSNAQPSGSGRPASAAARMLTYAVALDAWSINRGGPYD
ncbi:hypothetical protein D3C85_1260860 [compost metagenome]